MKHLMTVNICMAPLPISQDRFKRIGYLSPETPPKSTAETPFAGTDLNLNSEQRNDFSLGLSFLQE